MSHDSNPYIDRQVDELEVSVRTAMALEELEVTTVRELVEFSREELESSGKFSPKSLREVVELLGDMGLNLRPS